MVIFLLSDYSVYIQLYLHFFLFDTINRLFICLAIRTDKYLYSALWMQSSVSNINCNHPVLVVVGREVTLNWGLGEQILMFVLIQCVTRGRSLHLHVLLPFLFALTYSEAGIAFPCEPVQPLKCFPPSAKLLILYKGPEGTGVAFLLSVHMANGRLSRSGQRLKPQRLHLAPLSLNSTVAM